MRRKDREVTNIIEILQIIEKAKVLHLALFDADYPYIVPLHYGYEYTEGILIFYMHCAKEGYKLDLNQLAEEMNDGRPVKVVANLPYYITTPIIMGLFESHVPVDNITVMVQKEVAERMQAGPGSKDYGALSLAVQYYADPYIVANVPPN